MDKIVTEGNATNEELEMINDRLLDEDVLFAAHGEYMYFLDHDRELTIALCRGNFHMTQEEVLRFYEETFDEQMHIKKHQHLFGRSSTIRC